MGRFYMGLWLPAALAVAFAPRSPLLLNPHRTARIALSADNTGSSASNENADYLCLEEECRPAPFWLDGPLSSNKKSNWAMPSHYRKSADMVLAGLEKTFKTFGIVAGFQLVIRGFGGGDLSDASLERQFNNIDTDGSGFVTPPRGAELPANGCGKPAQAGHKTSSPERRSDRTPRNA